MALSRLQITKAATGWYNVLDYGQNTTPGTTDMTTAIQAAITAAGNGGAIYIPAGLYKTTAPLLMRPGQRFFGDGSKATFIVPTAMSAGAVFTFDPGSFSAFFLNNEIAHLQVNPASAGSMTDVIKVIPNATWLGLGEFHFHDLIIDTTSGKPSNSGILLENSVHGLLDNISFRGDCTVAHIELASAGGAASTGNYSVSMRSIYSGGNNLATPFGIKMIGVSAAENVGCSISETTLQNHTTAGIGIYFSQGTTITGYYSEKNVRALIAGDWGTLLPARNLTIVGGRVWSSNAAHKGFLFDYAKHVSVVNPSFQELTNDNWIEYGRVAGLTVQLSGDASDSVHDRIRYNANSDVSTAVTVITAGVNDSSILMTEAPSITLMTTNLGAATARKHYKMQVDNTGAWVATSWVPTVA